MTGFKELSMFWRDFEERKFARINIVVGQSECNSTVMD